MIRTILNHFPCCMILVTFPNLFIMAMALLSADLDKHYKIRNKVNMFRCQSVRVNVVTKCHLYQQFSEILPFWWRRSFFLFHFQFCFSCFDKLFNFIIILIRRYFLTFWFITDSLRNFWPLNRSSSD